MRVLIVGCGYVGVALGRRLAAAGHEVCGLRRTPAAAAELAAAGIMLLVGDLTQPGVLAALPGSFDWVVNTVSSSHGGADAYRAVYLEGTRRLVDWLAGTDVRRFVYTGSTSVYAQDDGSEVDEAAPTMPAGETGRVLVATEDVIRSAAAARGLPAVILRVAGIYGPGRGHLFRQYLQGEARISGDGSRRLNMIHREDVAGAIVAALTHGRSGAVYNAVDDEPVSQLAFFRWLASRLGGALPPPATAVEDAGRRRGLTDKRVSNQRLRRELGWVPRYPTFREGYTELIREAGAAAGPGPGTGFNAPSPG